MDTTHPFHAPVDRGEMALAWLDSHASIMLKTIGATIVFDPVGVELPDHFCPDAAVVTHEHLDHFDRRLLNGWQEKLGTMILGSAYIAGRMQGKATVLQVERSVSVGDIRLVAEPCDHPANEPLSFMILPSGLPAIYHSNDSDPFSDMARIHDDYEPHLLIYTGASISKAAHIAEIVRPKLIVSCSCDKRWETAFAQQVKSWSLETETKFLQPMEIWRLKG
jgi:L-ascorbate metabolism protein UlaG (beta-lactamase superfamily)